MTERVILAYSGGLDTSVAISWIGKETGSEVVAVAIDVGQGGEDMEVIRQRALDCGAVEAVVVDARDEFADDYCLPAYAVQRALHGPLPAGLGDVPAADRQASRRRRPASTAATSSRTAAPARATTRSGSRSASARWRLIWRCSRRSVTTPGPGTRRSRSPRRTPSRSTSPSARRSPSTRTSGAAPSRPASWRHL